MKKTNCKKTAIIISRTHAYLNFGQTVQVLDINSDNTISVIAHGDNKKRKIFYTKCWFCDDAYDYSCLNTRMDYLKEVGDYICEE